MTDASATAGHRPTIVLAVVVTLAVLSAAATVPAYVNHDAAWYLHVVQRWLHGAELYRDVIDTNPPLIIWISALPVCVAELTGWSATALFKVFVYVACAAAVLTVRAIVRRTWPQHEFMVVSLVAFLVLPFAKADFGQREHFAVLLTLPYVFATAAGHATKGMVRRSLIGAAAGLGFAIKPHFVLAWLAIEALALARHGRKAARRPELVAAMIAFAAYGLAVLVFTPAYLDVAREVRAVYSGLNSPFAVLVRLREVQLWLLAMALCAAIRWPPAQTLPQVFFASGTGYLAAALLQFKGWGYQLYPARVFIILFLGAAIGALVDELPSAVRMLRGGRRGLAAGFAAAMMIASVRYVAEARRPAAPDLVAPLIAAIAAHAPRGPVAALSMRTIVYPAFPAINYSGAEWALRHNSLWFLPGFYAEGETLAGGPLEPHAPHDMSPLERRFFDQIVNDLCAAPPRLLAIERAAPAAPAGRRALDLHAYYGQSPRAQALLDAYVAAGTVGPFTLLTPATTPSCR